jgi:undecaprenyl-diphosphatase
LILLVLLWKKFTQRNSRLIILLGIVVTIGLADIISAGVLKPTAARLRPSHRIELAEDIHLHRQNDGTLYKGGQYGFVSSHAANHMAIAIFVGGLLASASSSAILIALIFWAIVIGISRIYLGVHFPSDVFFGWMLGGVIGIAVLKFATTSNTINPIS